MATYSSDDDGVAEVLLAACGHAVTELAALRAEVERLTEFICRACREASRKGDTHPGMMHQPGICDCPCRGEA